MRVLFFLAIATILTFSAAAEITKIPLNEEYWAFGGNTPQSEWKLTRYLGRDAVELRSVRATLKDVDFFQRDHSI